MLRSRRLSASSIAREFEAAPMLMPQSAYPTTKVMDITAQN
jgi:hypothetical protein